MQILILIFAEVLGLYGLIVALIMNTKADNVSVVCPPHNLLADPAYPFFYSATSGREKRDNGVEYQINASFLPALRIHCLFLLSPGCGSCVRGT